jgi:hypothetical protein
MSYGWPRTDRLVTAGNVFLADCPARLAVEIIADKALAGPRAGGEPPYRSG